MPILALAPQARKGADDAGRAEAALAAPGVAEGVGPPVAHLRGEAVDGRDGSTGDPEGGRHAGDPRLAVDKHGSASALALRAATGLRVSPPYPVAQHFAADRQSAEVGMRGQTLVDAEG